MHKSRGMNLNMCFSHFFHSSYLEVFLKEKRKLRGTVMNVNSRKKMQTHDTTKHDCIKTKPV